MAWVRGVARHGGHEILTLSVMFVAAISVMLSGEQSAQETAHEVILPLLDPMLPPEITDLVDLNREAAARVALIGLLPAEARRAAARRAISWMDQASAGLVIETNPFVADQRNILSNWSQALVGYVDGRTDSLHRIRAVSKANRALYMEMTHQ